MCAIEGRFPAVKTESLPDTAPRFWDICPLMMADSMCVFQLWQSVNLLLMGNLQQEPNFSTSVVTHVSNILIHHYLDRRCFRQE